MGRSETVGDRVRRHRRLRKLTQDQLAERSGVDRRQIGRLESGEVWAPAAETLKLLALALEVQLRDLAEPLGWYDEIPTADKQIAAEQAIAASNLPEERKQAALVVIRDLFASSKEDTG